MTYEEAIKMQKLNFLVDSGGDTYPEYFEAQKIAIEALEKAAKYRWHDLRKNPDDLPPYADEKDWFVCLLENYDYNGPYHYFQYNCKLKEFGFYLTYKRSDDHDFSFEIIDGVEYENVIAWKNIDPFKESEVILHDFDSV